MVMISIRPPLQRGMWAVLCGIPPALVTV